MSDQSECAIFRVKKGALSEMISEHRPTRSSEAKPCKHQQ